MILVHSVGILVLLAGIWLFARSQIKGAADKTTGQASVWKLNISGPPALILVMIGIFVFLYPFTPWWPPREPVEEEIPVTVPTTTTAVFATTTLPPASTTAYVPPVAPFDYQIYEDLDNCGGNVIEWFTDQEVNGWYIVVEVYNATTDEYIDSLELFTTDEERWFPFEPKLCEWEFFWDQPVSYEDGTYYWLYIYSFDDVAYSEDLLIVEYP